jgi:hypothetical protein
MDECGQKINNESGKVVATEGSRDFRHVISGERRETISLTACCNSCRLTAFLKERGRKMNSKMECRLVST